MANTPGPSNGDVAAHCGKMDYLEAGAVSPGMVKKPNVYLCAESRMEGGFHSTSRVRFSREERVSVSSVWFAFLPQRLYSPSFRSVGHFLLYYDIFPIAMATVH